MMVSTRAPRSHRLICRHDPETLPVSVASNGFGLPFGLCAEKRTVFLTLDVERIHAWRRREPFVEIRCGEATHRQYFEHGAGGLRHVNLSPVLQEGRYATCARVGLRSDSLRWKSDGSLTLFESPALESSTLLVLAPHPDDAELAAFGVYASRPSASWVVTLTAGERGAMDLSRVVGAGADMKDVDWKAWLRVWDSVTVPQLAGVPAERCVNLAYPDGELEKMAREAPRSVRLACEPRFSRAALRARNRDGDFQGGSAECTWAGLVAELRLLLDKAKPSVVVCPHPLIDGHPDHVFTTVALEEALRHGTHRVPTFLLYVVHPREARSYPFGSGRSVVSLAPYSDGAWVADTIYSHPLAPEIQRAKYFAIEAHHDVRTYGNGDPKSVRQLLAAVKREVAAMVRRQAVGTTSSFLSRFARPNELFYVVCADSLSELVKRRQRAVSGV